MNRGFKTAFLVISFILIGSLWPQLTFSQDQNEIWNGAKVAAELSKKWQLSLEEQLRFQQGEPGVDRHLAELNLQYDPNKSFEITLGFRYQGEFDREGNRQGYREYLRYQVDLEHQLEPKRFTIKNRFRYQLRTQVENPEFRPEDNEAQMRWKTSLGYNIRDWKWDPEFVIEGFYLLGEESEFNRIRTGVTSEYDFGNHEIGIGIQREIGFNEDEGEYATIVQLSYSYKFDRKKKKKKKSDKK